jgi:uncharacterized protein
VLIHVDKLKRQPRQIEIDESANDFPVLRDLADQGTATFDEKLNGLLTATWAGDIIEVTGHVNTVVNMSCARCLAPVSTPLEVDVQLCYSGSKDEDVDDIEDVELHSEALGLIPFSGQEIDLRSDLEQEIVMALPQQLLCRESCQGLCPVCGANQNNQQCVCEKPVLHAGLAALKDFKVEQ